ncbi:ion transporter [Puniceicoccus vermicola]|uniref:Ion transporter n=1 Tax=Puniceicoccus vermicola TaxID=388746 RepID=A0A7X1E490_9BACT|nr:ion transporter [Puniceicoccus vermicola]MBC2600367.1 ion transporter [Puniceicoccus vermicola]
MSENDLAQLLHRRGVATWRFHLATWVESKRVQRVIISLIILNAIILGCETSTAIMDKLGFWLVLIDKVCLAFFTIEILLKLIAYRMDFWRSGWNVFDFLVVGIALIPAAGAWSVLRALRVLRIMRLLTVVPSLRRVVAAFLHSIPGLMGVVSVMAIFFYVGAVLATRLFGEQFPDWFGSLGASLYSLFQIMTLESWSMGIVRPVMEVYPWAWMFFIPFIMIATFTILNLFIGIIVSTMQELSMEPAPNKTSSKPNKILDRIEGDLAELKRQLREPSDRS